MKKNEKMTPNERIKRAQRKEKIEKLKKASPLLLIAVGGLTAFIMTTISMNQSGAHNNVEKNTPKNGEEMKVGEFVEGKHFYKLAEPIEKYQATREREVTEFFWYGCPHCYAFEPFLKEWEEEQPSNVVLEREHPAFGSNWVVHAKTFYALEEMGLEDKYHDTIMDSINNNRSRYGSLEGISSLIDESERDVFIETFNAMDQKVTEANLMTREIGIQGVPSIMIDGKYITSPAYAGTHEKTIELINLLKRK